MPRLLEKREMVATAYEISGLVPSAVYISEPTVLQYGMCCIAAYSALVEGDWLEVSLAWDSIGVETGFNLSKLKRQRIESMYKRWEREIVRSSRFQITLIPSDQWSSPRSVISTCWVSWSFSCRIRSSVVAVRVQSSTCTTTIRSELAVRLMKTA